MEDLSRCLDSCSSLKELEISSTYRCYDVRSSENDSVLNTCFIDLRLAKKIDQLESLTLRKNFLSDIRLSAFLSVNPNLKKFRKFGGFAYYNAIDIIVKSLKNIEEISIYPLVVFPESLDQILLSLSTLVNLRLLEFNCGGRQIT